MELRTITKADVEAVLEGPARAGRVRRNATSVYGRDIAGRAIVVFVADDPQTWSLP
jgi:hypothetical protein